jgi:hypothetical protein
MQSSSCIDRSSSDGNKDTQRAVSAQHPTRLRLAAPAPNRRWNRLLCLPPHHDKLLVTSFTF